MYKTILFLNHASFHIFQLFSLFLKHFIIMLLRLCMSQCPDSACKQDLLAYLQRIALYCHQLNICSKVKAEVQNLGGELIVSGVSLTTQHPHMVQSRPWVSVNSCIQVHKALVSSNILCVGLIPLSQ